MQIKMTLGSQDAHTIDWFVPSKVLFTHGWGTVEYDELDAMNTAFMQILEDGIALVYTILDDQNVEKVLINLREFLARSVYVKHSYVGWNIAVGKVNPLISYVIPMVTKIAKVNFTWRYSLDAAIYFIQQHDPTIDCMLADHDVINRHWDITW